TMTATKQLCSIRFGHFDILQVYIELASVNGGGDVGTRVPSLSNPLLGGLFYHPLPPNILKLLLHHRPPARPTFLPGGKERAVDENVGGIVQVGVFQHNRGVFATHLELDADSPLRYFVVDAAAHFTRSGKRNALDRRVFHQGVTNAAAPSGDIV